MGWLERPPEVHRCKKPYLPYRLVELRLPAFNDDHIRIGDRWQCDECNVIWSIADDQRDGPFWKQMTRTPPPNPGGNSF